MDSSNSSNSSSGVGNTKPPRKQISPAKNWSFTVFNLDEDNINNIISTFDSSNSSYILAKEICPETKREHLQCYCEFSKKCRPKNLFNDDTIHWEKSKGNRESNLNYCSKDGNIIKTNFKMRKPVKILKKEQLYNWQINILDIIKDEPDDRTIYWFYGKNGNNGKTTFCKYLVVEHGAIILSGKSADMKNAIVELDKQNGYTPELIVCNIPKSFDSNYLSYTGLEEIKDMLFYSGKYEGGMICGNPPHLIIFSNELPDVNKVSIDRWKIFNIEKNIWIDPNYESDSDED